MRLRRDSSSSADRWESAGMSAGRLDGGARLDVAMMETLGDLSLFVGCAGRGV